MFWLVDTKKQTVFFVSLDQFVSGLVPVDVLSTFKIDAVDS